MLNYQFARWLKSAKTAKTLLYFGMGLGLANPVLAQEPEAQALPTEQATLPTPNQLSSSLARIPVCRKSLSPPETSLVESESLAMVQAVTQARNLHPPRSDTPPDALDQSVQFPAVMLANEPSAAQPSPCKSTPPESPPPAAKRDPQVLYDVNGWTVRSHLQFGVNGVSERNLFWNLADTFAPGAGFNSDTDWLELYVKPGLSFTGSLGNDISTYGMLSAVVSGTLGTDAYDTGDTGRITLEQGYLGLRTSNADGGTFDVSIGPRELKLGTGMLIANGASNGFERGALKLGPRKSWEFAAIGRIAQKNFVGTLFYLDPNELPSNSSGTSLAGIDLRYDHPQGNYVGLTYANVLDSDAAYPQATLGGGAPTIIPGAREGLNLANFYGRVSPFKGSLEPLFLTLDAAYEWNNRIDLQAWAGRVQVGYTFRNLPWSPTLTYSYQTFSGDNPSTRQQERFDPLYYEGSPSSWATGSKSSMVFINSNVQAHQLALRLSPSPKDTITLRYAHIRANEPNSPVQFGQATRFDFSNGVSSVITGVTNPHLSDDLFLEYSRILSANLFLTAGVSISFPGPGIDSVLALDAPYWYGGFINVVFNF